MKIITKECLNCKKGFEAQLSEHKRGNAKYCSKKCVYAHRIGVVKPKELNCECAKCGVGFWKSPSRMRRSKSGLFFCTRKCKDESQKIGGISEIMPAHYGKNYRTICWSHHKKECIICGEDKIVAVHHYDHNHYNNDVSNLIPLCPTHHQYVHSSHKNLIEERIDEWRNKYLTRDS
jgi:hypothetical protein